MQQDQRSNPVVALDTSIDTLGLDELDAFAQQGLITSVYAQLPSGKEATVYCCRAHPATKRKFLAAKVYREHAARGYRRRTAYFEGRERAMKTRTFRAIQRGSAFGHDALAGVWIGAEYDALRRLSSVGADVPHPLAQCGRAVLMEYLGNGAGPAPHLHAVDDRHRATALYRRVLWNVEMLLSEHLVHGDLSPYNILVWDQRPWIIDLPQAVDVRFNHSAFELLRRDVESVCTFFATRGVPTDPGRVTNELWTRYERAEL